MSDYKFQFPFPSLKVDDSSQLFEADERFTCSVCKKSRKFFCYSCSEPRPESIIPHVNLPITIDIIKHKNELVGKSTSSHARLVSRENVQIYQYPKIPQYTEEDQAILIFVSPRAVNMKSLFKGHKSLKLKKNFGHTTGQIPPVLLTRNLSEIVDEEMLDDFEDNTNFKQDYTLENLPIKKAVFIDSTWTQCRGMFKNKKLANMPCLVIQNRETKFWRPNGPGCPSWFLATIEAIHQFIFEFHVFAWGIEKSYFDNCLQDLQLISTDWIPKEKIIESAEKWKDQKDSMMLPYNGQYDNLLYFFSFVYALVRLKVKEKNDSNAQKDISD
jgi:DTW domain